jgi:hypothetical protein
MPKEERKNMKKFLQNDEIFLEISKKEVEGICITWPYLSFKGIKNF